MPKFRVFVHFDGGDDEEVIEFDTQEEADEHAKEAAQERLSYGAELIDEEGEANDV